MKKTLRPESLMMSHGFKPELSEGSIKPPIFLTSTFVFKTAEEGKAFFELAYGIRQKEQEEELGLIYSRINNPNLQILEERLCLWDKTDDCAIFESGMSAISTVFLEFLKPGDLLVYSSPTYGGTDHFIHDFLDLIGIHSIGVTVNDSKEDIIKRISDSGLSPKLGLVYLETPANPTNDLFDISMFREIADHFQTKDRHIPLAVDNTYMGPIWCSPTDHGADLVIYSATKFIGGHSDLIAGAVLGSTGLMGRLKVMRTFLGNMASPHTCWLLLRSLETLKVRMEQQTKNAQLVAKALITHPKVKKVNFLGLLSERDKNHELFMRQYSSPGTMISFELYGGEKEAFACLNKMKLVKLAVSLGSTESLAQHPASMTHIGIKPESRQKLGITESLIRLSVGIEHHEDLIADLFQAIED